MARACESREMAQASDAAAFAKATLHRRRSVGYPVPRRAFRPKTCVPARPRRSSAGCVGERSLPIRQSVLTQDWLGVARLVAPDFLADAARLRTAQNPAWKTPSHPFEYSCRWTRWAWPSFISLRRCLLTVEVDFYRQSWLSLPEKTRSRSRRDIC